MNLAFSLTDVVVAGAALLYFIFSFLPFASAGGEDFGFGAVEPSVHVKLWSVQTLGWWVALADIVLLGTAVVALWWPKGKEYVGFTRSQIQVGVALFVALVTLGLYISLTNAHGWAGAICVILAIVAAAAAILGHLGMFQNSIAMPKGGSSTPSGGGYPGGGGYQQPNPGAYTQPAPGGYAPPPAGYQQPPAGYQPPPGGYPAPGAPGQQPYTQPGQGDTVV